MDVKDYYNLLGVSPDASQDDIKKAYRELAKKYHPDANQGNQQAEAKFKDISEAYHVLSDPERRKKYDQLRRFGHSSASGEWFSFDPSSYRRFGGAWPFEGSGFSASGSGFSISEILKDMFGFDEMVRGQAGPAEHETPRRQNRVSSEIWISFEEAIRGTVKLVELQYEEVCPSCRGTSRRSMRKCTNCGGSGLLRHSRRIRLRIPAGIENGHVLKLRNVKVEKRAGREPIDLYVTVKVQPHRFFKRRGLDIYCDIPVDDAKLQKGMKVRVSTVGGHKIEIRVPPGTKKGTVFKLPRFGIAKNGSVGDQFVKVV